MYGSCAVICPMNALFMADFASSASDSRHVCIHGLRIPVLKTGSRQLKSVQTAEQKISSTRYISSYFLPICDNFASLHIWHRKKNNVLMNSIANFWCIQCHFNYMSNMALDTPKVSCLIHQNIGLFSYVRSLCGQALR